MIYSVFILKSRVSYYEYTTYGYSNFTKVLSNFALIFGILGGIGLILVAVFSLDRAGPNGIYHFVAATLIFGGLTISISFLSICMIYHKAHIPKSRSFN